MKGGARMPAISRKSDLGSHHGAWVPSPAIEGSNNVFVDGAPALRVGDALSPHSKLGSRPHPRKVAQGSPTVFINGRPATRLGDNIDCGGKMAGGSGTVFLDEQDSLKGVYSSSPCARECMRRASRKGQAFVTRS